MKKRLFYFVFAVSIINNYSCNAQNNKEIKQQSSDTTKKIIDINIAANMSSKGMSDLENFSIAGDTLYLINKEKLLQVNLKTGIITANAKVSSFLSKQLKENNHAKQLVVRDNHFYISFLNELYCISQDGEANKIYINSYFINDFNVTSNAILIASRDSIKVISNKGKLLSSLLFDFTDAGYIKASSPSIYYSATPQDNIYSFRSDANFTVEITTFAPLSLNIEMEEPFISYATEDYFIAFDYWKRNTLYVLKKGEKKNEVIKTISLKDLNYMPTQAEIQKEEGQPNFKIAYDNGIYYAISLSKGKLKIKPFTL